MSSRIGFTLLILSVLLFSCSTNTNDEASEDPYIEPISNNPNNDITNNDIANHLSNVAKQVPDVEQAVSVVAGPYAVVGITLSDDVESERVGTVKYSVSEALKNDPYGKTAVVIANADVMERLREMADQMQAGYPIRGFVNELAEIVARYMPTFPVDQNQPDEDGHNRDEISPSEQFTPNEQQQNEPIE